MICEKKKKKKLARVQDKAASDRAALEEACCRKITFRKIKEGENGEMNTHSHFAVFAQHTEWKS